MKININLLKKIRGLVLTLSICSLTINAEEEKLFNLDENSNSYDSTEIIETAYPTMDVLHSIYKELIRQDVIRVGEGVLSMIDPFEEIVINEEILREVYDWALYNEFISLSDSDFISNDIKPGDFDYFSQQKKFWACLGAVTACAGEVVAQEAFGASLPCVAAAAKGGYDPWDDAWCLARLTAVGATAIGACAAGVDLACTGKKDTSGMVLPRVGGDGGKSRNGYCSENGRVLKVDIWARSGIVTKIKAYCTDGSDFTVGTGNGEMIHRDCHNGNSMVSGIYGRSGTLIDNVGIYCDTVTLSGKYHQRNGTWGGNGGQSFELRCPVGAGYIHGLEAKETTHYYKKNRRMRSLAAVCK